MGRHATVQLCWIAKRLDEGVQTFCGVRHPSRGPTPTCTWTVDVPSMPAGPERSSNVSATSSARAAVGYPRTAHLVRLRGHHARASEESENSWCGAPRATPGAWSSASVQNSIHRAIAARGRPLRRAAVAASSPEVRRPALYCPPATQRAGQGPRIVPSRSMPVWASGEVAAVFRAPGPRLTSKNVDLAETSTARWHKPSSPRQSTCLSGASSAATQSLYAFPEPHWARLQHHEQPRAPAHR